ncbi:protein kinase [Streptomyces sp. QHH-9511]|uniref:serine/threonine-protein kinase n=1 Tax=Streptomyces sp. QHH-9511 TaxID=2684468 RepID=UPI001317597D|nr:serine/threonine-protein kinase [Streptomyces sp. QHH-9511]QGZ52031.1 protein kinase [Streptomyces sp. QHH-9511]
MSPVLDILRVVGPALALRVMTLPLLVKAQQAVRRQALADPATPPRSVPGAVVGELALGVAGGVGLWLLLRSDVLNTFHFLGRPVALETGGRLSDHYGYALGVAWLLYVVTLILTSVVFPVLWARTQRTLLTTGVSGESWTSTPAGRFRLRGLVAVRIALGLLLPVGLALAAVVCQAVAYGVSRRYRHGAEVPDGGAPAPVLQAPAGQAPVGRTPVEQALADAPTAGPGPVRTAAPMPTRPDPVAGAVPHIAHQRLRPGEPSTIGGYHLLGRIGAGGMGTVYLARREGAATQVALKTINPELLDDADLLRRFQREAEALSMVSGAYTARVLDSGIDAGRPYLAMELLDGRPLDVRLREQGPIRTPAALRAMALALAVALSGVHRLGLVHRDLKPANIMLTSAGPRLLDFGIADLVDGTRLTRTGAGPGTLTYMAPEQFGEDRAGPAADVWAWACCVVCAAYGASPFAATAPGAVIRRIVDGAPEPAALAAVHSLDPELAAAVARALTADPAARPADGAALVELLTSHGNPHHEPTRVDAVREEITRGWRTLAL